MKELNYQSTEWMARPYLESFIARHIKYGLIENVDYCIRVAQEFKHLEGETTYDQRGGDYAVFTTGSTITNERG